MLKLYHKITIAVTKAAERRIIMATDKISAKQREFLDWEFGAFFHFGIRTFYEGHKDWDMKPMDQKAFNPTELDCEQWIKTVKEAGAKYAILVTKHHDGFGLWPSKYTEYCVKNTPWKDGKGDVVREYVDACRKYGLKVGLYYSPAQFETRSTDADEYLNYFVNQLSELLTNYGKIDYIWFDGCGSDGIDYDKKKIIETIRTLQKDILIFNMWDPDTRWVGNERGFVPLPHYNRVDKLWGSILSVDKDRLEKKLFLPAECDFKLREANWFYSDNDEHTRKSLDELLGLYYMSVGRGANFLINIGPDRRGLLPKADCERILEFGKEIKRRFANPIKPVKIEKKDNTVYIEFEKEVLLNTVVIKEDLDTENVVDDFKITADKYYNIDVYYGKTIGHKAICEFPHIMTKEIIITLNQDAKQITNVLLYNTSK